MNAALKLIFTGPMGAGKTTAIASISEIPPVVTDVAMTGERATSSDKITTTVAMDYGELTLEDNQKVMLFGTPGQSRYDFMCKILAQNALGVLLFVDYQSQSLAQDCKYFLDLFEDFVKQGRVVIAITHAEQVGDDVIDHLLSTMPLLPVVPPLYRVDPRDPEQVVCMVLTLLALLEFEIEA